MESLDLFRLQLESRGLHSQMLEASHLEGAPLLPRTITALDIGFHDDLFEDRSMQVTHADFVEHLVTCIAPLPVSISIPNSAITSTPRKGLAVGNPMFGDDSDDDSDEDHDHDTNETIQVSIGDNGSLLPAEGVVTPRQTALNKEKDARAISAGKNAHTPCCCSCAH